LSLIAAGHDCFHARRALDEDTKTIADTFLDHELVLSKANIHRVLGLNHARALLAWRTIDSGKPGTPKLRFFDTPRCRRLFEALRSIVTNPNNPEDALKIDANDDTGEGHDDFYDAFRYAVATRLGASLSRLETGTAPDIGSFDPTVLSAEHERLYRHRSKLLPTHTPGTRIPTLWEAT
jgi:hypothetical protein